MAIKVPGWRYHPTAGKRLVETEAEEAELGPGWYNSPAFEPEHAINVERAAPASEEPSESKKASKKPGTK